MRDYGLKNCEILINKYVNEYGGKYMEIEEGVLGLGTVLLHSAPNKKTVIIKEFYINPWKSGHNIRKYNKMPKKYQKIIEKNL